MQVNYFLSKEINSINQCLIDTMVNISKEDVNPSTTADVSFTGDQGVIVTCSYNAVALSPCLKSQYATPQLVCCTIHYRSVANCNHLFIYLFTLTFFFYSSVSNSAVASSSSL